MNTRTLKTGILAITLSIALHGAAGLPGNWEIRNSRFAGVLNGVASAPGQLVAVGQGGAILTSDDGLAWVRAPYNPGTGDFYCVTFGNGIYVAGGTLGSLMAISSDGVNWTQIQSTPSIHANLGVTFARGRFVVVGRGTSPVPNCRLLTSTNGIDWETVVRPTTNTLRAITFGNGKYVAVGDRGTIITSPDGIDWTVQNSGTEHLLRSVIFTGREFLAGGDSSSLLTSGDGISWVSVPFNSFDVRGLAACGTAVVGVGVLNPGGRVQSSPDGLSWTESISSFPAGLNAIVQYDLGRFIAVGANGLIIDSTAWADTPVNVWTKTTDGYWHEAHWSLGHVPTWKDYSVVLTNAGFKTLEIDGNTTTDYPDSLKLNALILDAPEGSHNSLWLNSAGLSVPLQINSTLRIPQNTSLVCGNSALVAPRLELSGQARFTGDASAVFEHGIIVGMTGTGVVYQVSGNILAEGVQIGGNVPGNWNQFGGVLEVGAEGLALGAGSTYVLTAGQLLTSDLRLNPRAELTIRGGSAQATAVVIPGGTLTLSQGTLITSNATIGGVASTPGRFVQAGGEHRVDDTLTIEGVYEFRDGLLKYRLMQLKGELNSDRKGGIWNSDVEFDGGILRANTDRSFNRITLVSTGTIDLRSAAALIRFEMTGPWSGILVVTNWLPNASHLHIGRNDSGLSAAQLSQIRFVNPGGFSPGIYSARILSSGEVVPVPRLVSYQRNGNSLVLTWPAGYRLLTATNVAGPYSLLTNAISPYTACYTDPQRFFITANEN